MTWVGIWHRLRWLPVGIVLGLLAFAIFGPILNMLLWAVAEKWYFPHKLPLEYGLSFWERVFRPQGNAMESLGTSIAIALFTVAACLAVSIPAGYALARRSLPLRALILLAFLIVPLLIEFPVSSSILRMGRRLETRLRIAFLEKIPRLGDRYFRSRLTSDMMQRAHDLRQLRMLPSLGFNLLRTGFQLILTTIGVIWLDPQSAPLAILGTLFFIGLTFLTRPLLEERGLL